MPSVPGERHTADIVVAALVMLGATSWLGLRTQLDVPPYQVELIVRLLGAVSAALIARNTLPDLSKGELALAAVLAGTGNVAIETNLAGRAVDVDLAIRFAVAIGGAVGIALIVRVARPSIAWRALAAGAGGFGGAVLFLAISMQGEIGEMSALSLVAGAFGAGVVVARWTDGMGVIEGALGQGVVLGAMLPQLERTTFGYPDGIAIAAVVGLVAAAIGGRLRRTARAIPRARASRPRSADR